MYAAESLLLPALPAWPLGESYMSGLLGWLRLG